MKALPVVLGSGSMMSWAVAGPEQARASFTLYTVQACFQQSVNAKARQMDRRISLRFAGWFGCEYRSSQSQVGKDDCCAAACVLESSLCGSTLSPASKRAPRTDE